jgi:hypothetical protein
VNISAVSEKTEIAVELRFTAKKTTAACSRIPIRRPPNHAVTSAGSTTGLFNVRQLPFSLLLNDHCSYSRRRWTYIHLSAGHNCNRHARRSDKRDERRTDETSAPYWTTRKSAVNSS